MSFTRLNSFSKKPSDLPDVPSPSMSPDDIRSTFETPLDELLENVQSTVDTLNSTTSGSSGADNTGATGWTGVTNTVQALINWLKANKTDLTGDHKGTWQGFQPTQTDPGIQGQVDSNTSQLAGKPKNKLFVKKIDDNTFRIAYKYSDTEDVWVDMARCGVNQLMQISEMWRVPNTSSFVLSDLNNPSATVWFTSNTDFIGPYTVKANANADGDSISSRFTGGWHGYNGDDTGTPTAQSLFYGGYINGVAIDTGVLYSCDEFVLNVKNGIQGYNTAKIDGSGRTILEENITYTFRDKNIEISQEIVAKEDITIEKYYGMQTQNTAWYSAVNYRYSDKIGDITLGGASSDSGTKTNAPNVDSFVLRTPDLNNVCVCWVDNSYSLGKRANVDSTQPLAFTSGTKTYHNLVNGISLIVSANQSVGFRGGYIIQGKRYATSFRNAYYQIDSTGVRLLIDMYGAVFDRIKPSYYWGKKLTLEKTSNSNVPNDGLLNYAGFYIYNGTGAAQTMTYNVG